MLRSLALDGPARAVELTVQTGRLLQTFLNQLVRNPRIAATTLVRLSRDCLGHAVIIQQALAHQMVNHRFNKRSVLSEFRAKFVLT